MPAVQEVMELPPKELLLVLQEQRSPIGVFTYRVCEFVPELGEDWVRKELRIRAEEDEWNSPAFTTRERIKILTWVT